MVDQTNEDALAQLSREQGERIKELERLLISYKEDFANSHCNCFDSKLLAPWKYLDPKDHQNDCLYRHRVLRLESPKEP